MSSENFWQDLLSLPQASTPDTHTPVISQVYHHLFQKQQKVENFNFFVSKLDSHYYLERVLVPKWSRLEGVNFDDGVDDEKHYFMSCIILFHEKLKNSRFFPIFTDESSNEGMYGSSLSQSLPFSCFCRCSHKFF